MTHEISNVLTAIRERSTQEPRANTPTSPVSTGDWLKLETMGDPQLENLRSTVISFHADLMQSRNPRWLSLLGKSDTGKTHCAKAIWREIKRSNLRWNPGHLEFQPVFTYWPKLVEEMRDGNYGEFRDMAKWPYLCLDEIGAERDPNGFSAEKLSILLGSRTGRWTVITGNLGMADVAKIDLRIASRMERDGSQIVQLTTARFATRK